MSELNAVDGYLGVDEQRVLARIENMMRAVSYAAQTAMPQHVFDALGLDPALRKYIGVIPPKFDNTTIVDAVKERLVAGRKVYGEFCACGTCDPRVMSREQFLELIDAAIYRSMEIEMELAKKGAGEKPETIGFGETVAKASASFVGKVISEAMRVDRSELNRQAPSQESVDKYLPGLMEILDEIRAERRADAMARGAKTRDPARGGALDALLAPAMAGAPEVGEG